MSRTTRRSLAGLSIVLALLGVSCSSGDDSAEPTSTTAGQPAPATDGTTATSAESTTTTAPGPPRYEADVAALAADELTGRDNQTEGSRLAQDYLIEQLTGIADPLPEGAVAATGPDAYRHGYDVGTNVLAIIPGGELADEYVLVGAHYDHLGSDCRGVTPADDICNGATDNAAGVAALLAIARSIAADDQPPRRSVVLGLWDGEEDEFNGSRDYLAKPPVPLEKTIAYVNFDIQGSNLSPALADTTVMVGAETGGPNLVAAALRATEASTLDTIPLSLLFGQGRSDHAVFVPAKVPVVFFTDANAPCYHTVGDDLSIVDFDKLGQQIANAEALVRDLVATDDVPVFDATAPIASFEDAVSMRDVVAKAEPDFTLFDPGAEESSRQFLADLNAMVDAGEAAFDDAAVQTLLEGSVGFVRALSTGECQGFLDN